MESFFTFEVVLFKGELMILKRGPLGSQVMREDGSIWLTCELGLISEFEVIGEF